MSNALENYLSPTRRLEAYVKVILLEAKGVFDEMARGCDDIDIGKEEINKAARHALARCYWLVEQHPSDKHLIQQANRYAAQLLKITIRKVADEDGIAKGSAIQLD